MFPVSTITGKRTPIRMLSHFNGGAVRRLVALVAATAIAATATVATASTASADDLKRTSDRVVAQIEAQPWPVYARGDKNIDILAARMVLSYHGYDSGPHSNFFNRELRSAVHKYQAVPANNLPETGELDEETWLLLRERTFGEFGPGDEGIIVRMIQTVTNEKFDAGLSTDGLYGPATRQAVHDAQGLFGIGQDGIFGPLTFRALIHYESQVGQ